MKKNGIIYQIDIASPCQASWAEMKGDNTVRACDLCHKNVYDISSMTAQKANDFIRDKVLSGKACVRLYRRADGTILTDDCPVGLKALRNASKAAWQKIAAVFYLMVSAFSFNAPACSGKNSTLGKSPFYTTGLPAPISSASLPPSGANSAAINQYIQEVQESTIKSWHSKSSKHNIIAATVHIDKTGNISTVSITKSSGDKRTDQDAVAIIRKSIKPRPNSIKEPFNVPIVLSN